MLSGQTLLDAGMEVADMMTGATQRLRMSCIAVGARKEPSRVLYAHGLQRFGRQ
jgi:hypothetical protein